MGERRHHGEEQVINAVIAKRLRGTPIKLVWTREDDVRGEGVWMSLPPAGCLAVAMRRE